MRYKKIMILAILLVSLLAVSAVSAADNTTSDILSIEETTDEVVSVEENHVLRENNNVGTFTDLANEIASATEELNLTKNYTYSEQDSKYKNGIKINKEISINGNGFTISGKNKASAFDINAPNVILNNINFINSFGYDDFGSDHAYASAIYWGGANGTLSNCNFIN